MSLSIATLPIDVEASAYAAACESKVPQYVWHDGDGWQISDVRPSVGCWVYMPPGVLAA